MSTQQQLTDDQLKEIALQNYKNEEVKSYNFPIMLPINNIDR